MGKGVFLNFFKSFERMFFVYNRLLLGWYSFEYCLFKNLIVFNISFQLNLLSIVDKFMENCNEILDFFRCFVVYFLMFNVLEQLDQFLL